MTSRLRLPRLPRLPTDRLPRYRGPIPRPRLMGFLAGIIVPLLLLLLANLAFQVDLGSDGPLPWSYLDEE